ncbi:MAG: c-type cytochrome [Chitinophagaceae bacterium]|nr:c-type cytochrome [Chitinophagaceae bacterium]
MNNKIFKIGLAGIILGAIGFISCKDRNVAENDYSSDEIIARAPVLSPETSIKHMHAEEGFEVKPVCAEPLISSPVAMTFDEKGRIWAVEMIGYMPDTLGTGEEVANGKIVILEDKDKDGVYDTRKVFMDSLVLPRAICLIDGGVLVAEPPRLLYVKIDHDSAGKKTIVDTAYAEGGNVEHQPNGLLRAMDNWIYNAKSSKRYRKKGDQWLIEKTHFRGQWGISQDDFGRLFYNNNSQNLIGDYFLPGFGSANKNQKKVSGFDTDIVKDNRVYPARPTPGVNRGYMKDILDDRLRLVNFTAASGPVIYRGDLFKKDYYQNAFVPEPSANLIKRNILTQDGYAITGRQAYSGKEFLTSVDERFRPVSLYNGPDGALYIVDMYRGIIQHKTYLTPYLKNEISKRSLTSPLNCGRIYKVAPAGSSSANIALPNHPDSLVALLSSPNGWVRDKAQQMLVDGKPEAAIPLLKKNIESSASPVLIIHSLWTLEGLNALDKEEVMSLLGHPDGAVRSHAVAVLLSVMDKNNYKEYAPVLKQMIQQKDSIVAPYIGFLAKKAGSIDPKDAREWLLALAVTFPGNAFVADAIISNLENEETLFYRKIVKAIPDTNLAIHKRFQKVISDIKNNQLAANSKQLKEQYPKGVQLFQTICQTCHGADGNGIASLAPPLNNSDWVTGNKNKLIAIALYGLSGPVKVQNKLYKAPEINGDMPGIASNKEIGDEEIAQVLSYIRKSWNNNAGAITKEEVTGVRQRFKSRQNAFSMEELNDW